jgi:hypothetical protein
VLASSGGKRAAPGFSRFPRLFAFVVIGMLVSTFSVTACTGAGSANRPRPERSPGGSHPAAGGSRLSAGGAASFHASEMTALRTLKVINYFPAHSSWAYMWEDFQPAVIEVDMARIAALHATAVRIIVSIPAFGFPDPHAADLAELSQVIQMARQHGLRVQLTLFDSFGAWADIGGSEEWVDAVLGPYAADPEIALIELHNEIDPASPPEMAWSRRLLPYVEKLAGGVPVTISVTGNPGNLAYLRRELGTAEPDIWDYHYYGVAGGAYATFAAARAIAAPEPLFIGEFGFSTWPGNAATVPGLPSSQQDLDIYQAYYYAAVEAATKALGLPPAAPWTLNDFSGTGTPPQPTPAQYFYGLYRLNGSAKPAAAVLSQFFGTGQVDTYFNQDFTQLADPGDRALAALWQLYQPGGGTFGADPATAYAGGGSARLSGTAASCPAYTAAPPDGFASPGQSVSVAAYVRGADAAGSNGLAIVWMTSAGTPVNYGHPSSVAFLNNGTSNWTKLQVISTAPPGAAYAQIDLFSCSNTGTVWFSDVHFSPAAAAAGLSSGG